MTDDDGSVRPKQTWLDGLRTLVRGHRDGREPTPVPVRRLLFVTGLTYLLCAALMWFFQLIGAETQTFPGPFAVTPLTPVFTLMIRQPIRRRWRALVSGGIVGITVGNLVAHGLYGHFVHMWADFCGAGIGGLLGVLIFALVTHIPV